MTLRPRGLVVDDKPEVAQMIMDILDYGFSRLEGWEAQWSSAYEQAEALRLVRGQEFDFAIIDYQLKADISLSVVKELRRLRGNQCFILVVTAESDSNPSFLTLAKDAGADHAIIRSHHLTMSPSGRDDQSSWDGENVARRIRQQMRIAETDETFKVAFSPEAGVQSMLHSLGDPPGGYHDAMARGEQIARSLIIKCLEGDDADATTTVTVHHLAPGRSGAHVCKVVRAQPERGVESFVLKIGLDRAALSAEKAANNEAARILKSHVLLRLDRSLEYSELSGYSAIAADLVADAVTLRDWLRQPSTTAEQAATLAETLHGSHLTPLFQPNLRRTTPITDWLTMSPVLRVRVLDALATYADIWKDDRGAHRTDADAMAEVLRSFVDSGTLPDTDAQRLGDSVTHAYGFGDLHSGNVLVQTAGAPHPLLIDASHYGVHHWATDATRLLVDLVLQVRRPGVASMLWSNVATEAAFAGRLCDCAGDLDSAPEEPADAFIAQVIAERVRYMCLDALAPRRADWHWQWHVALARELLRQGSRPGLLPTRAVVALTAAAGHLRRASEILAD